jgi:hypothetical protein
MDYLPLASFIWRLSLYLKIDVNINKYLAQAMIDSGATSSFISPMFQRRLGLKGVVKAEPIPLTGLDGQSLRLRSLTLGSGLVSMTVGDHVESIVFDVTPLGKYDAVLGIPWLRDHNPTIN